METKLKQKDKWTTELVVELNSDELKRYIHDIEHAAAAHVEVDGFRKGHVPPDIARQHLDAPQVLHEALSVALEKSLSEAITANSLDVIRVSDLKVEENTAERLRYTVILHLYPAITLPDLAAHKVKRRAVTVDDKEITDALETLRNTRATFTDADRPAGDGDRVEVDFTVTLDNAVIEGGESKNHPLVIGGKNFMPGFEEALIGLRAGEEKRFSLTAPTDYYQQHLAGKNLDFHVTMRKVQAVERPALTDAFAQSVGQFQNLDQLRGAVREGLYAEKEHQERQRLRGQILDELIGTAAVEVPPSMVDEQLDTLIADFDHSLHERGMELGMYLARLKKTHEELRKDWRADAERQVKIAILVHKVAQENHISVQTQEVEEMLGEALQTAISRGKAVADADIPRMREALTERMLNERALDFIEGICAESA